MSTKSLVFVPWPGWGTAQEMTVACLSHSLRALGLDPELTARIERVLREIDGNNQANWVYPIHSLVQVLDRVCAQLSEEDQTLVLGALCRLKLGTIEEK